MNWVNKFYKLKNIDKFAIISTFIIVVILLLVIYKQGIETLGLAGSSGSLMPFLHHSRWGAIMALIGSWMILKYERGNKEIVGMILTIIGLILVFHHLATEQCFSILTETGRYAGGIC